MKNTQERLILPKKVRITEEAYKKLRKARTKKKESMARIVTNLITEHL